MTEPGLERRRLAAELKTVREALGLGYRLQVICMACDRRPPVDLHRLARQGYGDRTLRSLGFKCIDCVQRRRKMSIHPPGKDTFIKVLFPGEI